VVKRMCEQVAIMYLGRLEMGPSEEILARRGIHYTRALIAAVQGSQPGSLQDTPDASGDTPSNSTQEITGFFRLFAHCGATCAQVEAATRFGGRQHTGRFGTADEIGKLSPKVDKRGHGHGATSRRRISPRGTIPFREIRRPDFAYFCSSSAIGRHWSVAATC